MSTIELIQDRSNVLSCHISVIQPRERRKDKLDFFNCVINLLMLDPFVHYFQGLGAIDVCRVKVGIYCSGEVPKELYGFDIRLIFKIKLINSIIFKG